MFGFTKKEQGISLDEIVSFYKNEIERIRKEAKDREKGLREEVLYYRDAYERLAMSKSDSQEERAPQSTLEDMADEGQKMDPALAEAWNRVHGDSYFLAPLGGEDLSTRE